LAAVIDGQSLYVADCHDLVADGDLLDGRRARAATGASSTHRS